MPNPYVNPHNPTSELDRGVPYYDRYRSQYWDDLYYSPEEYADMGRTAADYDAYLAEQSRDTSGVVGGGYSTPRATQDLTERQYAYNQYGGDRLVGKDVQLQAMLNNPETRRILGMLYQGIGPDGQPLLDERVMGMMEAMGYHPGAPAGDPFPGADAPPANQPPGAGANTGGSGATGGGVDVRADNPNNLPVTGNPVYTDPTPPGVGDYDNGTPVEVNPWAGYPDLPARNPEPTPLPVNPPVEEVGYYPVYEDEPVYAEPEPPYDPYNPPGVDPNAPPYMEPPWTNPGPQAMGGPNGGGGNYPPQLLQAIDAWKRQRGRNPIRPHYGY